MDYKKAYEDALERAKCIYNENPSSSTAKFMCGQIFPEIKDSEDERIRSFLYEFIKICGWSEKQYPSKEECLAYLEKQKAQRPAEWSGEDDAALDYLHELISFGYTKNFFDTQTAADMRKWVNTKLKSLRPQPHFADASKMEQLNVDILRDWSMKFAPDIRDAIKATAYHFWNLAINSIKEK